MKSALVILLHFIPFSASAVEWAQVFAEYAEAIPATERARVGRQIADGLDRLADRIEAREFDRPNGGRALWAETDRLFDSVGPAARPAWGPWRCSVAEALDTLAPALRERYGHLLVWRAMAEGLRSAAPPAASADSARTDPFAIPLRRPTAPPGRPTTIPAAPRPAPGLPPCRRPTTIPSTRPAAPGAAAMPPATRAAGPGLFRATCRGGICSGGG